MSRNLYDSWNQLNEKNVYGEYIYYHVNIKKEKSVPYCWSFISGDEYYPSGKKKLKEIKNELVDKYNSQL